MPSSQWPWVERERRHSVVGPAGRLDLPSPPPSLRDLRPPRPQGAAGEHGRRRSAGATGSLRGMPVRSGPLAAPGSPGQPFQLRIGCDPGCATLDWAPGPPGAAGGGGRGAGGGGTHGLTLELGDLGAVVRVRHELVAVAGGLRHGGGRARAERGPRPRAERTTANWQLLCKTSTEGLQALRSRGSWGIIGDVHAALAA